MKQGIMGLLWGAGLVASASLCAPLGSCEAAPDPATDGGGPPADVHFAGRIDDAPDGSPDGVPSEGAEPEPGGEPDPSDGDASSEGEPEADSGPGEGSETTGGDEPIDSGDGGGDLQAIVFVPECEVDEDCDDDLPCTLDLCLEHGGCAWVYDAPVCVIDGACHPPGDPHPTNQCLHCDPDLFTDSWASKNLAPCDDGDVCTTQDVCFKKSCAGGPPLPCEDGEYCNGQEVCDSSSGCVAGEPPSLDDGVECTLDSCDEPTDTILHEADHALCEDGFFCNGEELCNPVEGCVSITTGLDDEFPCTIAYCDEESKEVFFVGDDSVCDDGDVCTTDDCDPKLWAQLPDYASLELPGCYHIPFQPCGACDYHSECQDGFYCNGEEICDLMIGCIYGPPIVPDDGIPCTVDGCNEEEDFVFNIPEHIACPEGQLCNPDKGCQ